MTHDHDLRNAVKETPSTFRAKSDVSRIDHL